MKFIQNTFAFIGGSITMATLFAMMLDATTSKENMLGFSAALAAFVIASFIPVKE